MEDAFIKHDPPLLVQLDYLGAARCRENQKQFRARHVSHWKQHPPPSTHNMLSCGLPESQVAFRALRVFKGHQLPECEGLNADPKQSNKSTTVAVNPLRHERLKKEQQLKKAAVGCKTLESFNHTPWFPYWVLGATDTVPVASCTGATQSECYQPKYAAPVTKLFIGTDLTGKVVFAAGPDLGPKYDGHMWTERAPWKHIRARDARHAFLGDGAFSARQQVVAPARKPPNVPLPHSALFFNDARGFGRSPIEQFFGYTWTWSLFRNIYVCKEEFGEEAFEKRLNVMLQIVAFVMHRKWKFAPYGPWEHTPQDIPLATGTHFIKSGLPV